MEELPFTRSDAIAVPTPRISVPRSTMCDVVIVKTGRHEHLKALLGDDILNEYDPWAVKAAVDSAAAAVDSVAVDSKVAVAVDSLTSLPDASARLRSKRSASKKENLIRVRELNTEFNLLLI